MSSERVAELLSGVLPAERIGRFEARDGVPARPLAAPATLAEAVAVVRLARSERWTVLPLGTGSKLGWARPPERCELVLASTNLSGVLAYEPGDGTLTARAGTPWAELEATTRARHHLSPELPGAARATLGGVLGAGASGLDRLRYGPLRHQVLGIQALQADGTLVKSGGRVVKNVTGYDLHRLWCGSHGTLCFLLEATLRLYPAPPEVALLRLRCADLATGLAHAADLLLARLQPVAVVLATHAGAASCELVLVLAGRAEALAQELELARQRLAGAEWLRGDEARRARAELRERELAGGAWAPLVLATRPSALPEALSRLARAAGELALPLLLECQPLLGRADVRFPGLAADDDRLARLAGALADAGVVLHWRGLGAKMPSPALPPVALALMQRLKHSLDPDGLFVRGRLHDEL